MKKKIAAILVSLCLLGMPLMADEIKLNNGELVTGNIVELGEDTLRIATVSGEIFIPRNKVASAFLGLETPSLHPKENKAVETSRKDPAIAPDLGAMGGDFLEE
jgi:hypothetical protein